MTTDMKQLLNSMESTMRLRAQASAERRAREAERAQQEFKEKLMRAAADSLELESTASRQKGKADAVQRDQLTGLLMAGF